jgi:hypothetical protein
VYREASHCDFEDPTNNFCRVLCGRSSDEMQQRVRSETVRAALEMLDQARPNEEPAPEMHATEPAAAPESTAQHL